VLRDVEKIDTSATLFGHKLRLPVIFAPIGSLQDIVEGGGIAPCQAAAKFGVVHMLSSACSPGLEEVAACNEHAKIFQLYVRGDQVWVDDYVERVVANKYIALCLTVDLDYYGRRERDLAKRYVATARRGAASDHFQARFSWADVARIRKRIRNSIYVSNHGGRQLDHGKGSIAVLAEVADAVRGRAELVVDGGFMRGNDIVKAMALGAKAVGIGRLQGLAAAAAGVDGMVRMLELLQDEVTRCLGLLGVTSFAELDKNYLAPVAPVPRPWLDSAFPLLKEGY
jgi:glycolate oxidase